MKRIQLLLCSLVAMLMLSASTAWAQYVKFTAEDGTVSWIEIEGEINGENIEITCPAIDLETEGSLDLNEVWSESGGEGTHYQVTRIGDNAFSSCSGLTSVAIPSSVTSIGWAAFYDCSGLTSIVIPSSVTSIGVEAFSGCEGLTSVEFPSSVISIENSAFSGCRGLTSITIPSSVTSIGEGAFSGCSGLTSVVIPSSVTSIGEGAFIDCSGLTSIEIPSSVISIENSAFDGCSGLTSIDINTKTIENWFRGLTSIKTITLGEEVTSIGNSAFSGCSGLTSIEIPSNVTSIGNYAFSGCSGLTSITIPSSVTSIGMYAFSGCKGLTSIVVASGNSVYDSRNNCNAIIETASNTLIAGCKISMIPSSVTSIGGFAFYGCTGLTSITIPSSVTSIGNSAFYGCSGLTSVVIPSSVTSIGNNAFNGCSGLTSVTSYITEVFMTGTNAFYGCDNATLYVPKGLANFYRITADWNRFKKIEEMQEVIPGTIVVSCNNKGKVKINGTTDFTNNVGEVNVFDGMENTFVFQPNNNCELRQVLIDGLDVTLSVENNQLTTKVHEGSKMIVMFDKTSNDVNGDGQVDISDVVRLVNIILGQ